MKKYKYYIEQELDEHMLYSNEIAKLYGILSCDGNPHTLFITNFLESNPSGHPNSSKFFYNRSTYGLKRVYPIDFVKANLSFLFKNYIADLTLLDDKTVRADYEVEINKRKFKFYMIILKDKEGE